MKNSKRLRAFTLIELSIAILIIGILIVGVIQGSKVYYKSQLLVAQNLTHNSPVSGIKDLMLWYETSLDSSFNSTEKTDGTSLSAWYDNNPQLSIKNNATQTTTVNKPTFIENAFPNGIPGVRFDGSHGYFIIADNAPIEGQPYTIFVIEQKRATISTQTFLLDMGGTGSTGETILLGWNTDTKIILDKWNGGISYTNSAFAYSSPTPRMHTFRQDSSGSKYWSSGGTATDSTHVSTSTLVLSGSSSYLGRSGCCGSYNGDIAEIIIYTRALTTEERKAIESYLSTKYSITITG